MGTRKVRDFIELLSEMLQFIKKEKSYWLAPLIFFLLLFGTLFFVLEGSVLAPFIYAIF